MNKKIAISIVIILVIISAVYIFLNTKKVEDSVYKTNCNIYDQSGCDRSCISDSDCRYDCGCRFININQKCEDPIPPCEALPSKCIDNVCGEWLNPSSSSPKIIERSVMQVDRIKDTRTPIEACNSIIQEVKNSNPDSNCTLIDSKRIDSPDDRGECIDGASIAGCFACTFECK